MLSGFKRISLFLLPLKSSKNKFFLTILGGIDVDYRTQVGLIFEAKLTTIPRVKQISSILMGKNKRVCLILL